MPAPRPTTRSTKLWDAFAIREVNEEFTKALQLFRRVEERRSRTSDPRGAKLFASRLIGRLLFVWFLRRKGLIANGPAYFDTAERTATKYYDEVLKQLFFRVLNTRVYQDIDTPYLNGGLFESTTRMTGPERQSGFPEEYFMRLYEHFGRFNFTTDESSPDYEQVAIDPEMLGRVFESSRDSTNRDGRVRPQSEWHFLHAT